MLLLGIMFLGAPTLAISVNTANCSWLIGSCMSALDWYRDHRLRTAGCTSIQLMNRQTRHVLLSTSRQYQSPEYRLAQLRYWYGNSVRLSVCPSVTTRYRFKEGEIQTPGFHHITAYSLLVSYAVIWCSSVRRLPSNEDIKEGYTPLRNRYFTFIGWSSVKTVADRHSLAAYHNKHCWRAFRWYQHRWPWRTINPQIGLFT